MARIRLAILALATLILGATPSYSDTLSLGPAVVVVEGVVDSQSVFDKANDLLGQAKGKERIDLIINSPGGSVYAGLQFVQAMRMVRERGTAIRCIVTQIAASMAFQFLAECDERYAFGYSLLLWHPVRVRIGGFFGGGSLTPEQAVALSNDLIRLENVLVSSLRERFPVSDEYFYHHYLAETLHFASELEAAVPGWITVVEDVIGMNATSKMGVFKGKNGSTRISSTPEKAEILSPSTDTFWYGCEKEECRVQASSQAQ